MAPHCRGRRERARGRTLVMTGLIPGVRLQRLLQICQLIGGVERVVLEQDAVSSRPGTVIARIMFGLDRRGLGP